jgi:CRISPR-associated protein Csm1
LIYSRNHPLGAIAFGGFLLGCDRATNLPSSCQQLTSDPRQDLLFIYAGGDDLFVSGAWNQVVEFTFDVYQSFRAYTGNHPDITAVFR